MLGCNKMWTIDVPIEFSLNLVTENEKITIQYIHDKFKCFKMANMQTRYEPKETIEYCRSLWKAYKAKYHCYNLKYFEECLSSNPSFNEDKMNNFMETLSYEG